ncbi:vacuolar sorting-associated 28-like protein 2-like [Micractinium conductrix]|uniref:Vacuolar protein sorting-associated protein 28 homolog n=1 Tax=Micractinium conductrix TaxID=554055 RepID=A0A2P6VDB3_9CHLO|nr:vacuolar sorting-associated 28-like protein 2-like [Micractinium conductrix]|eukprot:PSC72086.1 vacuolar sorting-associated 28-like protein 2-like [Micractinium conductrix]
MNSGSPSVDALLLKLTNKGEREVLDQYADLFAILKTTEKLERAYVRDAISVKEYEPACLKLIGQFRTLWDSLRSSVPDVEAFMSTYNMQCPMAAHRLIKSGVPGNQEHVPTRPDPTASSAIAVAETVQHFITAMDSIKLQMVAVDQIYPLISDLVTAMGKVSTLPPDISGRKNIRGWQTKLYTMPASYELGGEEVRQLLFDLESAYNEFMANLPRGGG